MRGIGLWNDEITICATPFADRERILSVPTFVVVDGLKPGFSASDAGFDTLGPKNFFEPVGVIARVTRQPPRLWQIVQKRFRPA